VVRRARSRWTRDGGAVRPLARAAERARVALEVERESGAELSGDAVLLGRLFDNSWRLTEACKSRISVSRAWTAGPAWSG